MLALATLLLCAPVPQDPLARVVLETTHDGWTIEREVLDRPDGSAVDHGRYEVRDPAGRTRVEGRCHEGERRGSWTWTDEDGRTLVRGKYRDGERHGEWSFRWPGGEKRAEGAYEEGLKQGAWSYWNADGSSDATWSGTWTTVVERHAAGTPRSRTLLRDGLRHGPWTSWWPDGRVQVVGGWLDGKRAGSWSLTHADGTRDPEMLAFEGPPLAHAELELEPLPLAAYGTEAGVGAASGTGEDAPAALARHDIPSLDPSPWLDLERQRELDAALDELRLATDRRAELVPALVERFGVGLAPAAVGALGDVDLATPEGVAHGAALVDLLSACCAGRSYGWTPETDAAAQEGNELAVLRWHSLVAMTMHDEDAWELGLALRASEGDVLLMQPVLADLAPGTARVPVPSGKFGGTAGRGKPKETPAEAAVARALEWLARHQADDGRWDAESFDAACPASARCAGAGEAHDVGCTGLALLAFLGRQDRAQHPEHERAVRRGLRWLIEQQDPASGLLVTPPGVASMYDHAIGTLALCEADFLSRVPALHETAEKAVRFILEARNPYSAWRYVKPTDPLPEGESRNDTSVTAWMVLALRTAEEVRIEVDQEAYVGALSWIDSVTDPATGRVGYVTPGSESARIPNVNDHYPPSKGEAMTAAALLCRFFLGQSPSHEPIMVKHADLIVTKVPVWDTDFGTDMYFWHYGTYAMFQMGGTYWTRWEKELSRAALDAQRKDGHFQGSWDPIGPWGFAGGRVYSTALMALSLEARTRYARFNGGR